MVIDTPPYFQRNSASSLGRETIRILLLHHDVYRLLLCSLLVAAGTYCCGDSIFSIESASQTVPLDLRESVDADTYDIDLAFDPRTLSYERFPKAMPFDLEDPFDNAIRAPINSGSIWVAPTAASDGSTRKLPEPDKLTVLLEGRSLAREYVFTFQASKGILTGTVIAPNGAMPISNGKINGETLSFSMKLLGGQFTAMVTGLIAGDELKLSGQVTGHRPFQITAKRVRSAVGAPLGVLKFKWYNTE